MASEVLSEVKSFSVSASTSNEAWRTEGDRALKASLYQRPHRMKPGELKEIEPSKQKSFQLNE